MVDFITKFRESIATFYAWDEVGHSNLTVDYNYIHETSFEGKDSHFTFATY